MSRRLVSLLNPRKLANHARSRLLHLLHRLGYHHIRLWLSGLSPRRLALSWAWLRAESARVRARRREPRLTVAVDIAPLWEPLTGIGWYLLRLLEAMSERDDVRLRLYGPHFIDKRDHRQLPFALPSGPAIEVVSYRLPDNFSIVFYHLSDWLRKIQGRLISLDRNQVLFAPNYLLPERLERSLQLARARHRGQLVATVHDLSVLQVPDTMRESTREQLTSGLARTIERAAAIITDAETVRGEIIAAGLASADKITAVPLAPAARFDAPADASDEQIELPPRYVLHVGTLEPRKNIDTLLAAWQQLGQQLDDPPPLVLCGGYGWKVERLRPAVEAAQADGRVIHLGYVSDRQLAAAYRGAEWLVMASHYEGFGLPAVEAMALGVPLLLSDIPVLREVAADAALFAPPNDAEAWVAMLGRALTDPELRRQQSAIASARVEAFDWARTADATVEVWRRAVEEEGASS